MKREKPEVALLTYSTFIILGCTFLASINFFNRYYYFLFLASFFFFITPYKRINFNSSFLILILFSLFILFFNPAFQTKFTSMLKPFVYPLCYLMGSSMYLNASKNDLQTAENNVKKIIYVLSGGLFTHYLLNMFVNLNATNRNAIDFWSKETMSATSQASLAALMVGVAAALLFSEVHWTKRIIAVVSFIVMVWYNLILAGRTLFALIAILMIFAVIHRSIVTKQKIFKTLLIGFLIVLVFICIYNINLFGLKTYLENTNLFKRFFENGISKSFILDTRINYKFLYLKHFFKYPFGGNKIKDLAGGKYAHDLYLDTYSESGIFAFIAIVIYIVLSLVRMVKCMRSKQISFETRQLIACIYIVVNIQFWLEPIITGMPWLLVSYAFIDGAVTYLLSMENKQTTKRSLRQTPRGETL